MPQVRLSATLKATGLNVLRSVAFKNRVKRQEKRQMRSDPSENRVFSAIKDLVCLVYNDFVVTVSDVAIYFRQTCIFKLQAGY
jgi:hypothetical protein